MKMPAIMLSLFLFACDGNAPPVLGELRLSAPTSQLGAPFYVTLAGVEDPDGNVYAGKVRVKAEPKRGGGPALEEELFPDEPGLDQPKGDIIVGVSIRGDVPLGPWRLEVVYEDEAGAATAPGEVEITLTR